jgi:hypothetical protein
MDTYISEIHKEAIEEYIDNLLKEKHLNMPNVDDYTEHRIKQLAKDMFYVGYKDALETEELELVEQFEMKRLKGIDNPETLKKINSYKKDDNVTNDEYLHMYKSMNKIFKEYFKIYESYISINIDRLNKIQDVNEFIKALDNNEILLEKILTCD